MYEKEDRKTSPSGIRFNEKRLAIALSRSGKKSKQQLVDFLIEQYVNGENPVLERKFEYANGANEAKEVAQNVVDLAKGNYQPITIQPQHLDKEGMYMQVINETNTLDGFKKVQKAIEQEPIHFKTKARLYEHLQKTKTEKGFIYND